jgi:hypothetical protein
MLKKEKTEEPTLNPPQHQRDDLMLRKENISLNPLRNISFYLPLLVRTDCLGILIPNRPQKEHSRAQSIQSRNFRKPGWQWLFSDPSERKTIKVCVTADFVW